MKHLGVPGFKGDEIIEDLRSHDAALNPPKTLEAVGCAGKIEYRWPTMTDPLETYADEDVDEDTVHWGVCRPTGEIWVFESLSLRQFFLRCFRQLGPGTPLLVPA